MNETPYLQKGDLDALRYGSLNSVKVADLKSNDSNVGIQIKRNRSLKRMEPYIRKISKPHYSESQLSLNSYQSSTKTGASSRQIKHILYI